MELVIKLKNDCKLDSLNSLHNYVNCNFEKQIKNAFINHLKKDDSEYVFVLDNVTIDSLFLTPLLNFEPVNSFYILERLEKIV